jgi:hypothetical protein
MIELGATITDTTDSGTDLGRGGTDHGRAAAADHRRAAALLADLADVRAGHRP